MQRHELTDTQWAQLAPLLPPVQPRTGRPNHDHRTILNGILWKLATGVPWRDVPARYGPWPTLYRRFRPWRLARDWGRVFAAVQARADAAGQLDWTVHFVDGTVIRAHQHAAGAKKGAPTRAAGRARRSGRAAAGSRRRSTSAATGAAVRSPSS